MMRVKARRIINIVILVLLLAALGLGVYYVLTVYKVNPEKTYVDGNDHYSDKEIADMVMDGPLGDNSLFLSMKYKNKKITDVPFVDSISVSVLSNDSIRITVFEKALAGYVEYLDHFIYFDKDGYVVESSNVLTVGIPQVTGLKFDSVEIGKILGDESSEIFSRTLTITHLLEKYDLSADKIYYHSDGAVTLYFGKNRVDLGADGTNLEDKVMCLPQILPNLVNESGVLNMTTYDADHGRYVFTKDS